jgi:hypothetical protein
MRRYEFISVLLFTVFIFQSNRRLSKMPRQMQGNNLVLKVIQEDSKPQTIQHVEEVKDTLPPHFSHLIDIEDYFDPKFDKATVTPFFWHVAKAAGTSVQYYYSQCFRLIIASEIGASKSSNQLEIIKENGVKCHVNVDTSTSEGIMHAKELKLAHSHTAQMIISPLFYEATNDLFTSEDKGIMFAMFRHPIQRVISLFYYLQTATHEVTYNPKLAEMTIEEYAESPLLEANFIIRSLVNKMEEPLSMSDLNFKKKMCDWTHARFWYIIAIVQQCIWLSSKLICRGRRRGEHR